MRKKLLQCFYSFIVVILCSPFMENAHAVDYTLSYHDPDAISHFDGSSALNQIEFSISAINDQSVRVFGGIKKIKFYVDSLDGGFYTQPALQPFLHGDTDRGVNFKGIYHKFNVNMSGNAGIFTFKGTASGHIDDSKGIVLDTVNCQNPYSCNISSDEQTIIIYGTNMPETIRISVTDTGENPPKIYTGARLENAAGGCIALSCTHDYDFIIEAYSNRGDAAKTLKGTINGKGKIMAYTPIMYIDEMTSECSLTPRSGGNTCDLFRIAPQEGYPFDIYYELRMKDAPNQNPFTLIFSGGYDERINLNPHEGRYNSRRISSSNGDLINVRLQVPESTWSTFTTGVHEGTVVFTITLL